MERDLLNFLQQWQNDAVHSPILLRGARQVGKTYLIDYFGKNFFSEFLSINFEKDPNLNQCFASLDPRDILNRIYLQTGKSVSPGKTLLFLDEIQECPNAI